MNKDDLMMFWPATEAAHWWPMREHPECLAFKPLGRNGAWAMLFLDDGAFHSAVFLPERGLPDTLIGLTGEEGRPYEDLAEGAEHLRHLVVFLRTLDTNYHRLAWLKDMTDAVIQAETEEAKGRILSKFAQFDNNNQESE